MGLTDINSIITWFNEKNTDNVKNPYWVLYAGHDRRDNVYKRDFNYEYSDPQKAREKLLNALKSREVGGGEFHLTVSDKAKDNVPSASENITLTPRGAQSQTGINGIAQSNSLSDMTELIRLNVENATLKLQLDNAKEKSETDRINGINNPFWRWVDGLTKHPQFNPNTPFEMMNGIFRHITGSSFVPSNPQGLPQSQNNYGIEAPKFVPEQQQANEAQNTSEKPVFTYKVAEIAQEYHKLCETLELPPEERNKFIADLNTALSTMPAMEKAGLVAGLKNMSQQQNNKPNGTI